MERTTQYRNEPSIIDGDLEMKGGDYTRVCSIENAITILIGTDSGYWGNLMEPPASQIPGGLEKLDGAPITSSFLKTHARAVENALYPLIENGIAKSVKAESFNINSDRVDFIATIVMKDDSIYTYDSSNCRKE